MISIPVFAQKLRTTEVSVVLVAQRLSSLNDGFVEQVMRARPIVSRKIELEQLTKVFSKKCLQVPYFQTYFLCCFQ